MGVDCTIPGVALHTAAQVSGVPEAHLKHSVHI